MSLTDHKLSIQNVPSFPQYQIVLQIFPFFVFAYKHNFGDNKTGYVFCFLHRKTIVLYVTYRQTALNPKIQQHQKKIQQD